MNGGGRNGKDPFPVLPPKSPAIIIGARPMQEPIIGFPITGQHHQLHHRASSESVLIEEQPSWLDDLLNDPDTPPVGKGRPYHCRSSSDSFTYVNHSSRCNSINNNNNNISYNINFKQHQHNVMPLPLPLQPSAGGATFHHHHNQTSGGGRPVMQNMMRHGSSSSGGINKTQNQELRADHRSEHSQKNLSPQSDPDPKRAKQQFAKRSRVRKMQYIAELEGHLHSLQTQGFEVSAEIQFLDQQNIILQAENDTLRQRLDGLLQEHLIKQYQQETLEREIDRIRSFVIMQQQQQQRQQQQNQQKQTQQGFKQGRSSMSREVDTQFANLSLKQKDSNSAPLRM